MMQSCTIFQYTLFFNSLSFSNTLLTVNKWEDPQNWKQPETGNLGPSIFGSLQHPPGSLAYRRLLRLNTFVDNPQLLEVLGLYRFLTSICKR